MDTTSYFETRSERYNHEIDDLEDSVEGVSGGGPQGGAFTQGDTTGGSSAEDTDDTQSLFASFTSASPRYRRVHGSGRESFIEHRHSMSICEGSSTHSETGSDTSGRAGSVSSASGRAGAKLSLSPDLRRRTESGAGDVSLPVTGSGHAMSAHPVGSMVGSSRNNHMSCPDLETMVARAGGVANCANLSGGIPNRAIEIFDKSFGGLQSTSSPLSSTHGTPLSAGSTSGTGGGLEARGGQTASTPDTSSQTDSEVSDVSPLLHRRSRKSGASREGFLLPKFSIPSSMDESIFKAGPGGVSLDSPTAITPPNSAAVLATPPSSAGATSKPHFR